jgi:penicillin-binding protein 2
LAATVGNGGVHYKPYLIESIRTADGQTVVASKPEIVGRLNLKPETKALVDKGLWEVVNETKGTAHQSHFKNLEFSGKTGTAQVVGRPKEGEEGDAEALPKDHAWFVAFAPSIHPQIAVAVIIEHGEHGSSAAAPVAREIIRTYLDLPEDSMTLAINKQIEERKAVPPEPAQESEPVKADERQE